MLSCDCRRYSLPNKMSPSARHAVTERPAMHCGKLFSKITMTRRRWRSPPQSSRVPRISFNHALPAEDAEEEVEQENQLGRSQNECGNRNEHVHRLLRLKEHVLSRVIDAPHLAANSNDVHREKHAIGTDECEPEMNFSQGRIHEPPKHLRKPVIDAPECGEQRRYGHHQMKVGNDEIGILKLDVCSRCP